MAETLLDLEYFFVEPLVWQGYVLGGLDVTTVRLDQILQSLFLFFRSLFSLELFHFHQLLLPVGLNSLDFLNFKRTGCVFRGNCSFDHASHFVSDMAHRVSELFVFFNLSLQKQLL